MTTTVQGFEGPRRKDKRKGSKGKGLKERQKAKGKRK
jgi:hypothetical protein